MSSLVTTQIRLAHADKLFIDGKWVAAHLGGRIEVVSPNDGRLVATVAEATQEDMSVAVNAARRAFDSGPWPRFTVAARAEHLRQLAEALRRACPSCRNAWCEQVGALASVAPMVIGGGNFWFSYYADLAATFPFEERRAPFDGHGSALVVREPVGVVAAIVPWNNPFGIMTGKIAPALLAGCTIIMKPAPETPIEAHIIAEAAKKSMYFVSVLSSSSRAIPPIIRRAGCLRDGASLEARHEDLACRHGDRAGIARPGAGRRSTLSRLAVQSDQSTGNVGGRGVGSATHRVASTASGSRIRRSEIVAQLAARRTPLEERGKDRFGHRHRRPGRATAEGEADFRGTFQSAQSRTQRGHSGIERFSRKQKEFADQVRATILQLRRFAGPPRS